MTEPERKTVLYVRGDGESDRSEFLENVTSMAEGLEDGEVIIGNFGGLEFIMDSSDPNSFHSKVPFENRP